MGAQEFKVYVSAPSAKDAFRTAVEDALFEHGASGDTGTIAEKDTFVNVKPPPGIDPEKFANELLQKNDQRVCSKWGPCGCVEVSVNRYLFFGVASS